MFRRLLGLCLALLLVPVASLTPFNPATAAPAPCPEAAPTESAAEAAAKECGGPVEIASKRSETGRVFANPDGTGTVEEYARPQRVRRHDGSWAELDATLVANPDGTFSPRASTVEMKFSGGGRGALVTGRRDGHELSLSWPGVLPAPKVEGARATYVDVLPGVDLVVTALETGFSEVLVVKNRAAARNPKLRRFAFQSSLSGLAWRDTAGQLEAVDGRGRVVAAATAPVMWDSSPARGGGASGGRQRGDVMGPAEGGRVEPMGLTVTDGTLNVEPTAAMLDDPDVVYPLYLDPTIMYSGWTMINSDFQNQSYWSFDKTDCPGSVTGECAKVGHVYGYATMVYRSMWQFPTSNFRGKMITGATFSIDLLYSAWTAASTTQLRQVNATIGSGTTWGNNASAWSGTVAATVSNSQYPVGRKLSEFSSSTFTSIIQSVANSSATSTTWGLRAATESNDSGWKKFDADTARLIVGINNRPNTPDTLTVDGKACASGANRPVIATATPVLKARATDPDGDSMDVWFAWAKWNGSSYVDVANGHQAPVANTAYAQITTGTLEHGGRYTFRSQSNDSPSRPTGAGTSDVTHMPGNCEWEVDLQNPSQPVVTGDLYHENSQGCPPEGCGSVGQTGRFTLTSSSDVVTFKVGFTDPPSTPLPAASPGASVTYEWTPPTGGAKTLYVRAVDRAGRQSPVKAYQFFVAPPSPARARWLMDDPAESTTLADDTGNGWTATVHAGTLGVPGRILPGNDGLPRTALYFDGVDDYVTADGAALPDSSRSFSVAAWVRVDDTTARHTFIAQTGTTSNPFYLQSTDSGRWQFVMTSADTASPVYQTATSDTTHPARAGAWTHVTGVYDSAEKKMTIYVNGVAAGSATGITAWNGNGVIRMGGQSTKMKGALAEVQLWDRVLSATEVAALADARLVGLVGEWHMDEIGPGPAFDASGLANDLTFYGDAEIPSSGAGQTGTGLRLDGDGDYASPDKPVIYTDQSFTVSAWVRPTVTTGYQHFVTQTSDASQWGFTMYHGATESEWKCKMMASATDGLGEHATLAATSAPDTSSYHHLVCVFDAQKRELRLYLDGQLKATTAMNAAWQPWHANGPLIIGHEAEADIDEVRIYQGAVADVTLIP